MQSNIYSNNTALVLLSGGMDSTTCLYWAKMRYKHVHALSFAYGQKHAQELMYARRNAINAQCASHAIVDVSGTTGNSALVQHDISTSEQHALNPSLPSTFTPGRNIIFLAIAAGKAYDLGAQSIVTGVCATDDAGYPDCRVDFINAMTNAIALGTGSNLIIEAPLLHLTKAETWRLANELGIVDVLVNDTLTDYNGDETMNEWGRGVENNPASILRANGYREAKANNWL